MGKQGPVGGSARGPRRFLKRHEAIGARHVSRTRSRVGAAPLGGDGFLWPDLRRDTDNRRCVPRSGQRTFEAPRACGLAYFQSARWTAASAPFPRQRLPASRHPSQLPGGCHDFAVLGLRCSRRRRLRDQRVERLGGDAHLYQPAHSTGRGRPPRSETCPRPGGEPKVVTRASSGTADREARAIAYELADIAGLDVRRRRSPMSLPDGGSRGL
jgi:hypothetical protein